MQVDKLKYDENLSIAVGLNVSSKVWKNTKTTWSNLVQKLATPVVTAETYKRFMSATKEEQSKIKDVGGFVGGFLTNGRRDKTNVLYRQLITLDIDFSHENFWWDFTMLFDCAAVIHSTHKSCPEKPRHRLIIPLDREVSQEEYQAIARKVAGDLNIDLFDQSTFDVNRLMFWPSVSSDMEYYFEFQDGPFLEADYILGLYNDWHDTSEWPTATDSTDVIMQAIKKQEDPEDKKGIIGVFCRTYTIQEAIETFLSDVYTPAGEGRYTYINGSTAAGLIVYDDKFAYSHHGTDPAGGRLCNAFDLVRIHKFGHLDTGKEKEDKDKKSFKAMEEFASKDFTTKKHIAEEKFAEAKFEFAEEAKAEVPEEYDTSWTEELDANTKGEYDNSANNLNIIIQHDQFLKDVFKLNIFDNKRYVTRSLPWRKVDTVEPLRDVDYSGVRNYIECVYGIVSSQKVDDALALEFEKKKFHPIREYICAQKWDGIPRVNTLLIDYFGAEDNAYTRAAIRKTLVAAVARVFEPGIKFDTALILVGEQGTYKSTFVKNLGMEWFSDTFTTVQGKESFEQIQGAWLIEMAELSGLKKAEVESIKHYISKREDMFRPAYGRTVETYKRQCVFFGTTNNKDFLRDPTGNRRFMPIDVRPEYATKSVNDDLTQDEVNQIWAEAYQLYLAKEPLYLVGDEDIIAKIEQHKHSEADERKGIIEEYLNTKFPDDWDKMDLYDRRRWLEDPLSKNGTVQKDFVCIAEVWCECLGKDKTEMSRYNTREVNEILRSLPEWEAIASTKNFPLYGKQKYYKRKDSLL
jgi:predicted P-loop ATPase